MGRPVLRARARRPQLAWKPEFEPVYARPARNMATANQWRTWPEYDAEDLMAEAACLFTKLTKKYAACRSPSNFMALFCRSFQNRITNLAKRRTRDSQVFLSRYDEVDPRRGGKNNNSLSATFGDGVEHDRHYNKYRDRPVADASFNEVEFTFLLDRLPPDLALLARVVVEEDTAERTEHRFPAVVTVARRYGVSRHVALGMLDRLGRNLRDLGSIRPVVAV